MKKANVNKNLQLIRCWNDIQQWVTDNCKDITIYIPIEGAAINVNKGKTTITTDNFTIKGKSCYYASNRKSLTAIIRTQEQPFNVLEKVVVEWSNLKKQLLDAKSRLEDIYNFKA